MTFQTSIKDMASPQIIRLRRKLADREATHGAIATQELILFQGNFQRLGVTNKNKLGARSGFWSGVRSQTIARGTADAVIVSMPNTVALRRFGGTVTPKTSKFLTIPARKEAYGVRARNINDLRFAVLAKGGPALVKEVMPKAPRQSKGAGRVYTLNRDSEAAKPKVEVWYWLRRSTTIKPNPAVLPTRAEILTTATDALDAYFNFVNLK